MLLWPANQVRGFVEAVTRQGGENEKLSASDIRSSAGVGLSWISPVGPLKLSWGSPIRKKPTDRIEKFQFQIGTAF